MGTALQILGSLGLFLYGMKLMSEGLQKVSGERLRTVMRSMAGNRFKGVFSGTLVTAVIQSSSATTVMVVSFVNAGLLTLRESIGVIMGANLGTTTTAWIIAALGFKLELSSLALPLVGFGVIISFCKKPGWRSTGELFVGLGLLLMGLDFLKSSVPDMNPESVALEWLQRYSNMGFLSVLLFLMFGVLLTIIVQSSSVAVAITITMAAKGWIDFDLSAAIILGENIGTTITANIAAITANLAAKRAAIAHFVFNVLGVMWVLCVFYLFLEMIKWLVPLNPNPDAATLAAMGISNFDSLTGAAREAALMKLAIPERLAMFHTMFNFCNICLLISFVPQIEKITCWILRSKPDRKHRTAVQRLEYLSSNVAEMGELALFEGQKELVRLAEMSGDMFNGFVKVIQKPNEDLSEEVARLRDLEEESDKLSMALTSFFVQCSSHELSQNSIKIVTRNMIIVPELEEMCDSCYRLITLARKRYRRQLMDQILQSPAFIEFCAEMNKFVDFADKSLNKTSIPKADIESAAAMRKKLDSVRKSLRRAAISQMEVGGVTRGGILFIDLLSAWDRVNSHAMNILEAINLKSIFNEN